MKHELFTDMQKQMNPSPEVRQALSEKLARPAKKRTPWKKYAAVAACAALVIGAFSVYSLYQDKEKWTIIVSGLNRDVIVDTSVPLHSYVTVEGEVGFIRDSLKSSEDTGTGGTEILPAQDHNAGDLPSGAYVGDVPVQEGAEAYDRLAPYVRSNPDWYGGAYIDNTGTLAVCLVESEDPGDKSLELQVLDWADSDRVVFTDVKYSLAHLDELMEKLNHLPETDPKCGEVMASWYRDEMNNRVVVTLTEVNDHILSVLAQLDPDDDAIYVQVGQRVTRDDTAAEDPAVYHVIPGGATVPEDEDLTADEPVYDGAHYDVENLPAELPEQKQPAFVETDSVPQEDASTPSYDPDAK